MELLIAFLVATLTFAFVPGPSIFYLIGRTLTGGRAAGFQAMAGVHMGGYAHVIACVAGLSVLLETIPVAYTAIKVAGAGYVIWLGLLMLLRPTVAGEIKQESSTAASFRQSFLVELLNPTTALFYLAFLPQFAVLDAAMPVSIQLLIMGVFVNVMFSVADLPYVMAADRLRRVVSNSGMTAKIERIGGAVLVGLGIHLLLSRNA